MEGNILFQILDGALVVLLLAKLAGRETLEETSSMQRKGVYQ